MNYEILYQPSFAVARMMLEPGDSIRAESGAMVSMSPTITVESKMAGGLGKAIGRLFGGESLFQSTFTADRGAGEVLLAPAAVGDIVPLQLSHQGYMVTSGCYLAGDTSLEMETKLSGRSFFAGEGLFIMRVFGTGTLLVSSFGAVHAVRLMEGQPYIVDTGHIVAFSDNMNFTIRRAAKSWLGSFTSGEGFVAEFVGPGILYIQTRSPQGFGPWVSQFIPSKG
ncbi:MAG: TIGR00266 family protein [Armatimonadetes bacterium]|nr:TIGR00266 family protein [Armatimonadota bacterium]MCZ7581709.1 TIGR00266 family protein [Fimbriimonadaceae bacterium]NOG39720.1 TIGR00266 family protein [Armatimonadota bacterium]GIK33075.1 MAG: TIGR00266 family protein [Armatimonadota bacterium]